MSTTDIVLYTVCDFTKKQLVLKTSPPIVLLLEEHLCQTHLCCDTAVWEHVFLLGITANETLHPN